MSDASDRATAIITAFCASSAHVETHAKGEDVAGIELQYMIDELAYEILDASSDAEVERAKLLLFNVFTCIVGTLDGLMGHMEIDKFDMIPFIVQQRG